MLIYLDECDKKLETWDIDQVESLYVELISSSLKGYHDVHISRIACEWGLKRLNLPRKHLAHLKSMLQKIPTTAGILTECPVLIKLVFSDVEFVRTTTGFDLSAKYVLENNLLGRPATLVVENSIYDGEFYKLIFNHCVKSSIFKSYNLNIENGGGNTTASVFDDNIKQKRITVAIVDTDKRSPYGPFGDTHKKVMGVHAKHLNTYIGDAYATYGREAENILPTACVFELAAGNSTFLSNPYLAKCGHNEYLPDNFWDFFDLKKGFNGTSLLAKVKPSRGVSRYETPCVKWWAKIFGIDVDEIDAVIIPSAGANLLSRFLNNGNAVAEFRRVMRTGNWQKRYLDYFLDILWFFCASRRVRA